MFNLCGRDHLVYEVKVVYNQNRYRNGKSQLYFLLTIVAENMTTWENVTTEIDSFHIL